MSATLIGFSSGGTGGSSPGEVQPPWGQATFSAEDFEGEDEDEDEEAALLSPDEEDLSPDEDDEEEDLSLLPDFSPPPEDDEDESAEDPAAADAGSEAVAPFRLSVR
jgi:hypothetical protein